MNAEQRKANTLNPPKNFEFVVPVGNSWIKCRSTSHGGRTYYFNTLTGEASWDFSNTRIDKSKCSSPTVVIQTAPNAPNCLEPNHLTLQHDSENSADHTSTKDFATPRIYNKQIINNKFSKPVYPLSLPSQSYTNCNSRPFAHVTLNKADVGSNYQLWTVPPIIPTHNMYLTPSGTFHSNQVDSPVNMGYNISESLDICGEQKPNITIPLTQRFKIINESRPYPVRRNFFHKNNKTRFGSNHVFGKKIDNTSSVTDLRQLLRAKAKKCQLDGQNNLVEESKVTYTINSADYNDYDNLKNETQILRTKFMNEDKPSFSENEEGLFSKEKSSLNAKLSIERLWSLAGHGKNSKMWYILADTDIFLNNLNFLKDLIKLDEKCILMVPQPIISELEVCKGNAKTSEIMTQARYALKYIKDQIAAGHASIDDCESYLTSLDKTHFLLDCCSRLLKKNYHVIILSNSKELLEHRSSSMHIFTVLQITDILSDNSLYQIPQLFEKHIKITSPNDKKTKTILVQTDDVKGKVDASVQTDIIDIRHNLKFTTTKDEIIQTATEFDYEAYNEATADNGVASTSLKKREINLKRTSLNQNSSLKSNDSRNTLSNVEKKQFKWRRRRNQSISNQNNSTVSSSNDCDVIKVASRSINRDCLETHQHLTNNASLINEDRLINEESLYNQDQLTNKASPLIKSSLTNGECTSNQDRLSNEIFPDQLGNEMFPSNEDHLNKLSPPNEVSDDSLKIHDRDDLIDDDNTPSERSNSVILHMNLPSEKVIIEESSTSGVVSNSVSNDDSESVHSACDKVSKTYKCNRNINTMFEISDPVIEEYIQIKCEEWISRFVQIMEEALTQSLLLEPDIHFMPPPWTILEATECVKKRFHKEHDVVDAANKFSIMIKNVSDDKGNIRKNLKPLEYIEMYSHGVYLVNILQKVLKNCEDLHTAANSLKTLLDEIRNPNYNNIFTFGESTEKEFKSKCVEESQLAASDSNKYCHNSSAGDKESVVKDREVINSRSTYRLRSCKKAESDETHEEQIKVIRQTESIFFSSLNLQKNPACPKQSSTPAQVSSINKFTQVDVNRQEEVKNEQSTSQESQSGYSDTNNKSVTCYIDSEPNFEPKIIRKFSKCLEYEERLKKQLREPLDLDQLDYSVDQEFDYFGDDNYDNEYYKDDDDVGVEPSMEIEYDPIKFYEMNKSIDKATTEDKFIEDTFMKDKLIDSEFTKEFTKKEENNILGENRPKEEVSENNDFKLFLDELIKDTKDTLMEIYNFSVQSQDILRNHSSISEDEKTEIKSKAEEAIVNLSNTCKSLNSLNDEGRAHKVEISLLNAGVIDAKKTWDAYRTEIVKCKDHAEILLGVINLILSAVKH